jgi:hypothetical protein
VTASFDAIIYLAFSRSLNCLVSIVPEHNRKKSGLYGNDKHGVVMADSRDVSSA